MDREQKIAAFSMRLDGATYQEIAETFGVTRQYIHQILAHGNVAQHKKVKYPNIRKWMEDRSMNFTGLHELAGAINYSTLIKALTETCYSPSKKTIDAILMATGMTYEEAFASPAKREERE